MIPLPKPGVTVSAVLTACVASVRDPIRKAALAAATGVLNTAETDFKNKAAVRAFHLIAGSKVTGALSAGALKDLYTGTMVPSAKTRSIYESIRGPLTAICPLCAQRNVGTLDHYLPKTDFDPLAITPLNLVPSCRDCNTDKQATTFLNPGDQTLHPYYDNLGATEWLHAEVVATIPVSMRFSVSTTANLTPLMRARLEAHLIAYNLHDLYSAQAGILMNEKRFALQTIAHGKDLLTAAVDISDELSVCAQSALAHRYTWKVAAYRGLAASIAYCGGLYLQPAGP